jgi:hypothetical protein
MVSALAVRLPDSDAHAKPVDVGCLPCQSADRQWLVVVIGDENALASMASDGDVLLDGCAGALAGCPLMGLPVVAGDEVCETLMTTPGSWP